ncbi:MAG: hypothetical protein LBI28_11675 [Treponema sp.]|jgi:hypothetical protein|nr:hypothetical protein [Treponema sp.]
MDQFFKRKCLVFLLLVSSFCAIYAQRIPAVGVTAFDAGSSVTASDAANITSRVIAEFRSWGTLNVVQGSAGAEYIVRGSLSRANNNFVLTATTVNASTGQVLNEYSEQARTVNDISVFSFCSKATVRVPLPNYLAGTWQSTINMPDGPVVCIIEFRTNRSVMVERFDTWEHKENNALRYEGYGEGTYSYAGYAQRIITVNQQQIRIDAVASVNLTLEETLPEQANVNVSGLNLVFNADKTSFEIVNGSLLCGRNYDGASVYPSAVIGFSRFTKIR